MDPDTPSSSLAPPGSPPSGERQINSLEDLEERFAEIARRRLPAPESSASAATSSPSQDPEVTSTEPALSDPTSSATGSTTLTPESGALIMHVPDFDPRFLEGNLLAQMAYRIGKLEGALAEKDARIEGMEALMREKDAYIEHLDQECQDLKDLSKTLLGLLCRARHEAFRAQEAAYQAHEDGHKAHAELGKALKDVRKSHEEVRKCHENFRKCNEEVAKCHEDVRKSLGEAYKSNEDARMSYREMSMINQELCKRSEELGKAYEELHKSMDDSRTFQARNAMLQNEILLMQGDVRIMMRLTGKKPAPRAGQVKETQSTPDFSAAKQAALAVGMASTPQGAQAVALYDLDATPTPIRATPAKIYQFPMSTGKGSMAMAPYAGSPRKDASTTGTPTQKLSSKKSVTFTPMPGAVNMQKSPISPGMDHFPSPGLRERASFNRSGRSDDPFASPLSRQSSTQSLHSQQSSTDLNSNASSRAMASANWRQPKQQQAHPSPDGGAATLQDLRQQFQTLLAKIERWADVYTGTIHSSVRSKEEHTAALVRTLASLVAGFDVERLWNDFGTRTLLVAAYINRRVLGRLFGDDVLDEICGGENKFQELVAAERGGALARDPMRQAEMVVDKAEMLRKALASGAGFRGWRGEEVRKVAGELFARLSPIVPISERVGGLRELEGLVGEAIRVVFAMRCLPCAWHLAFDELGARIVLSSMTVRGLVERRTRKEEAAGIPASAMMASSEEEHAVVLGITPHLVSKLWTPGGVVPEELLKAEVLLHPVGRNFSMHRHSR